MGKQKPPFEAIAPRDGQTGDLHVIIETPKGSPYKYAFDHELGLFTLTYTLPLGQNFPFDFGYIPQTLAEDGDPLDVLMLMDFPTFTGCVVPARLIGVLESLQETSGGKMERNDRLIGVAAESNLYRKMRSLHDLRPTIVQEIERFFVDYNMRKGKEFEVTQAAGPKHAEKLLRKALRTYEKRK